MRKGRVARAFLGALAVALVLSLCVPSMGQAAGPAGGKGAGDGGAGPFQKGVRKGARYRPGEIIVRFKEGADPARAGRLRARLGAAVQELPNTGLDLLRLPAARMEQGLEALRGSGLVEYAEPNYIRRADFTPSDPDYAAWQWNLSESHSTGGGIGMENAWDGAGTAFPDYGGDPSITVAVLDTGIAYRDAGGWLQAPDMSDTRFVDGYDFINRDGVPYDDNGHGTHVAGTVAASTHQTGGEACAGIAFNCSVMPVKVLDNTGSGSDAEIIQGIVFAADNGADVLNLSLSGPDPNEALRDAIDYAFEKDTVVCSSAGNDNSSFVGYPAAYPNCIAVGATTRAKARASYSNHGSALDVMAPGGNDANPIYQQTFNSPKNPASGFGTRPMKGTSMASPHVAGVCALVKSVNPGWSAAQVRSAVCLSCHDLGDPGWDAETGWGLIDAHLAVTASEPGTVPPSVDSISPDHDTSGATTNLTIGGSGFHDPVKVVLERIGEPGVSGTGVTRAGTIQVNATVPLAGTQPGLWDLVVEDKGMRSATVRGGFMVDAADGRTWYLAEGTTDHGFEEYIQVQNPGSATANVQMVFMTSHGASPPHGMSVPPLSRATVRVNDIVFGEDISTRVTSDRDVICERAMYWGGRLEGTDSIGVQAPSYTWHFSEGSTDHGFETFLVVQNPGARSSTVHVTYLTPDGPVEKDPFVLDAQSRRTIDVADDVPAGEMSLEVVADERVVCERSMYWDGRRGGHASIGTNSPAGQWFLAEGTTGWGFTEYLTLGNPGGETVTASVTYMTAGGAVPQGPLTVPAGSRVTVPVNAALPGRDASARVTATGGIVAERSMYWDNGTGRAGHCALGVPQPRQESFLAEGSTGWGFEEWIVIQNPNPTACDIGLDLMTGHGLVPTTGFSMRPNSRVSIDIGSLVPGTDTSARVYSNLRIVSERVMYWNGRGGGHVSPGLMR